MFSLAPAIPAQSDLEWCWFLRRFGRAGDAIERALYDIGVMDHSGWARWQRSTMTGTGAPVVVRFASDDASLSIITEVANPAHDPKTRFATACSAITALGGHPPAATMREIISAAQGSSALTYGARLGLRHDGKSMQITLFVELPKAAADLSGLLSQAPQDADATMLAYGTQTKQVTFFYAADTKTPLPAVLAGVQPTAIRCGSDDTTGRAYHCARMANANANPRLSAQLHALKDRIFNGYPCLIELQLAQFAEEEFLGNIWISPSEDGRFGVSFDIAAPWIGAEQTD